MKNLQKAFTLLIALVFILNIGTALGAESYVEYEDLLYSFSYPSAWKQDIAKDGTITLKVPGKEEGVMTFALAGDFISHKMGGDGIDEAMIEKIIDIDENKFRNFIEYDGSYEIIEYSGLKGFRAFGKIVEIPAHIVYLWGENSLIVFMFAGNSTMLEEDKILSTIKLKDESRIEQGTQDDNYNSWQVEGFSLKYPKGYLTQEHQKGAMFINKANANDAIGARKYLLDTDYSIDMAPSIAAEKLPKSTKLKADPKMVKLGDWEAALISGNSSVGPLEFYIIGSGRTALALIFMGEEAVSHAETVVSSVVFDE